MLPGFATEVQGALRLWYCESADIKERIYRKHKFRVFGFTFSSVLRVLCASVAEFMNTCIRA